MWRADSPKTVRVTASQGELRRGCAHWSGQYQKNKPSRVFRCRISEQRGQTSAPRGRLATKNEPQSRAESRPLNAWVAPVRPAWTGEWHRFRRTGGTSLTFARGQLTGGPSLCSARVRLTGGTSSPITQVGMTGGTDLGLVGLTGGTSWEVAPVWTRPGQLTGGPGLESPA